MNDEFEVIGTKSFFWHDKTKRHRKHDMPCIVSINKNAGISFLFKNRESIYKNTIIKKNFIHNKKFRYAGDGDIRTQN